MRVDRGDFADRWELFEGDGRDGHKALWCPAGPDATACGGTPGEAVRPEQGGGRARGLETAQLLFDYAGLSC